MSEYTKTELRKVWRDAIKDVRAKHKPLRVRKSAFFPKFADSWAIRTSDRGTSFVLYYTVETDPTGQWTEKFFNVAL